MNYCAGRKLCPHVKNPFHDCYCFDLNSRTINSAINYCSSNFQACERYKKEMIDSSSYKDKSAGKEARKE